MVTVYNKWHETELERWLSDHNVPYPTPADRKDLEDLVKSNWQSKIATPYHDWDTPQLQTYLHSKGADAKKVTASNKDSLVQNVKSYWTETADSATNSYNSVKDWIFDGSSSIPSWMAVLADLLYAAGRTLSSKLSLTSTAYQYRSLASEIH